MLAKRNILFFLLFWNTLLFGQNVFFNEVDHLNPDLCVEIAAAPGSDLTNWFVTLYDETGIAYDTIFLTGVPPTSITPSGYNIIEVDVVFLSPTNGGLTLVDHNNTLIQFISHDGPLTAVDGPAAGQSAENIGTQTSSGNSIRLQGIGSEYNDFTWNIPGDSDCGFENVGQELLAPDEALPVELLYFEAITVEDYVELKWATASENNNQYFVIEKSSDGFNFESIAQIPGAINSNVEIRYLYPDHTAMSPVVYYRLVQVDTDGSTYYSDVIVLYFDNWEQELRLFPNPVKNQLNIFLPQSSDEIHIELFNLIGQKVFERTVTETDNQAITVDFNALPSGPYLLSVKIGELYFHEKVIKGF